MSKELRLVMQQAEVLTPDEQLQLISYLVQKLRNCKSEPKQHFSWREAKGIAPNLLGGMDAQDYINRIRRGEFPELEIKSGKEQ